MHTARKNFIGKRLPSLLMVLLMVFGMVQFAIPVAQAKTLAAQPAENVFFYVKNSAGKNVLLRVIPLDELHDTLSHSQGLQPGDKSGNDYFVSYTDNLPTYCYRQGVGFTLYELAEYVQDTMDAPNLADVNITYAGEDRMGFIPTDAPLYAGGMRSYNTVYGTQRYYFEDLYNYWTAEGFETNEGLADNNYYDDSAETVPKYFTADKNAVFATGVPMETILMTESYSDRIMNLAQQIADNNGVVANCLAGALERDESMSIGFTQTEQGMRTGERTASTNTKWIYQVDLDMANDPVISAEAVAAPTCNVAVDGNIATITFACDTPGAVIYHNLLPDGDGYTYQSSGTGSYGSYEENYGVMYEYTGDPIEIDMTGLSAMNIRFRAVKEGSSDAGLQAIAYPKAAPTFTAGLQVELGSDVVLSPSAAPGSEVWTAWTDAITGIGLRVGSSGPYTAIEAESYEIDNASKTITLDKDLFTTTGIYSIQISADGYQDRTISRTLAGAAPAITPAASYILGQAITLTFDDPIGTYGPSATVRVTPPGTSTNYSISNTYLERLAGSITIKESYMSYASGRIKAPGEYKLTITNNNFIPNSQDVVITVSDPSSAYTVSVDETVTGGTVTVNPASGGEGDTITVTVTPDSGKQLVAGSLRYTADSGASYTEISATGGVYSFTLPAANVLVTAQFEDEPSPGDKTPPTLLADATGNTVGQAVYLAFADDGAWRNAITGVTVNGTPVQGYTLAAGVLTIPAGVFTAAGDYTIVVTATDYSDAAVIQTIEPQDPGMLTPPVLLADTTGNTVGQAVYLAFADDGAWRNAVTGITVNGTPVQDYTLAAGTLTIPAGVFTVAGDYTIIVTATGYSDAMVLQTMVNVAPVIDFTYTIADNKVTITGYTGTGGAIAIPGAVTVSGAVYGVTAIGNNAFGGRTTITSVTIPAGVISIGNSAFEDCTGLTSVTLPAGLTSIGDYAFRGCAGLNAAYFLGNLPTLGTNVFQSTASGFVLYYHVSNAASWSGYTAYPAQAFCVLTLDLQDGSAPAGSYAAVDGNGHLAAPADPARENYTFGGWYKEAACVNVFDFGSETVTGDLTLYAKWTAGSTESPKYTLTPVADESVYEVGETGGIKIMTVKTGVTGLKYFGTQITPVVEHEEAEAVVFIHLRDDIQLSLNVTKADFDLVDEAQSGFNVEAGDIVKVFIVDDLTNDIDFNPTLLQ